MTIWRVKRLKELDQLRDATVNEGLTAHVMPNQAFGSDETVLRDDEIEIVKEPGDIGGGRCPPCSTRCTNDLVGRCGTILDD